MKTESRQSASTRVRLRAPQGESTAYITDLLAWASLALATLILLWPLGLTNRVLAGVDAFTYFTPYWAYRMAEFRGGHIPLWNPYLFLGVPFLANPQAAVLYPLHWPLSWLTPAQALIWSALLHVWLAAGFTYTFARRSLGLSRSAAWLAGAIFAFGGFTLARIENVNQLNTLAWLPASLWLLDEAARSADWRGRIRWGTALTIVLALQILAGHTQTLFINAVGIGLWVAYPLARQVVGYIGRIRSDRLGIGKLGAASPTLPRSHTPILPLLLALLTALFLSAAQLLPTLELNGLGVRTGGLTYRQAVSFSLRPRLLVQTFLPPFRGGLAEAFGSEGYAEFAGWVSVTGIVLAVVGVASIWRAWRKSQIANRKSQIHNPQSPLLLLAATGLFLAFGAYNPFYYLLWRFVPGFDLFRAPTRWLALYVLGMAGLAGAGLDVLGQRSRGAEGQRSRGAGERGSRRLVSLFPCFPVSLFLCLLVLAELWLGSRALPFTLATAPSSLSLRNAPAALLSASQSMAATADQPQAGRDRFLSMSDIRFDPGDLAELRALQADRLPADAVERSVRAAKQTEVLAPNLSLLWRLPAVDGYDGGMLPLERYVQLQSLFLPPELLLPDGRLREQLPHVPEERLLDLIGVRFIITDKQQDLWADDVYYDLQLPAQIEAGRQLTLDLAGYPSFSATALGLVAEVSAGVPDAAEIAEVLVEGITGQAAALQLRADPATRGGATPTRLPLPQPFAPTRIVLRVPAQAQAPTILRGLSLIDERTGAHQSVTVSPRGDFRRIHSGDVKIYERTTAPGRTWLVHGIRSVPDNAAALATLADPTFDPRTAAVITGAGEAWPAGAAAVGESVTVLTWEAERIALVAEVNMPAILVLADSDYPGWQATVDGAPTPILRTNYLFRGVALQPGRHEVVFTYAPASWRRGVALSLATLAVMMVGFLWACTGSRHTNANL